jgi:hypothetical protein
MPPAYNQRLIIIITAAMLDQANAAALVADPDTGPDTFYYGTSLRVAGDATNTVVGYFAGWTMTQEQRDRLIAEFGRSGTLLRAYQKGDRVPTNRTYWLFEDAGYHQFGFTFAEALATLGWDRMAGPDYGPR